MHARQLLLIGSYFSMVLNFAIANDCLQARCLKLITVKTLEKISTYEKSKTVTIQKRFLKSLVMSGVTYLCTIRLSKIGLKYMPKVAQI